MSIQDQINAYNRWLLEENRRELLAMDAELSAIHRSIVTQIHLRQRQADQKLLPEQEQQFARNSGHSLALVQNLFQFRRVINNPEVMERFRTLQTNMLNMIPGLFLSHSETRECMQMTKETLPRMREFYGHAKSLGHQLIVTKGIMSHEATRDVRDLSETVRLAGAAIQTPSLANSRAFIQQGQTIAKTKGEIPAWRFVIGGTLSISGGIACCVMASIVLAGAATGGLAIAVLACMALSWIGYSMMKRWTASKSEKFRETLDKINEKVNRVDKELGMLEISPLPADISAPYQPPQPRP